MQSKSRDSYSARTTYSKVRFKVDMLGVVLEAITLFREMSKHPQREEDGSYFLELRQNGQSIAILRPTTYSCLEEYDSRLFSIYDRNRKYKKRRKQIVPTS